ncbi:sigma-70 family RNA polymerase sigma factor [Faecalimonas umbilicata]|nr:sigma-70 family RNA polymerase sigma factor [Faecalimonas umbilicata]
MKVRYEFVTGEFTEIEVDDSLGELLVDFDRREYNNDHKETRRHVSLDGMEYEGELFASVADTADEVERREKLARLCRAMEALSPPQRELVLKVYFENMRVTDIARAEGVSEAAIRNRLKKIYARMKKFLI